MLDNRAPYGDTTIDVAIADSDRSVGLGAVSSITAAFIAQLLTLGVTERIAAAGAVPPVYISANIPEGDEHNNALKPDTAIGSSAGSRPWTTSGHPPASDMKRGSTVAVNSGPRPAALRELAPAAPQDLTERSVKQ